MPKLSIIIINYNTAQMTEKAIRQFLQCEQQLEKEIILIDNGSSEKINFDIFKNLGSKIIINDKNLGFAGGVNEGIKNSTGEYVLLLNSDVLIETNTISTLVNYLEINKNIGIIGPKIVYPDGRWQPSTGIFPTLISEFIRLSKLYKIIPGGTIDWLNSYNRNKILSIRDVNWITGGCMLIRKKLINEIGLFDENYFLGAEDFDYCYRAHKSGWKIIYYPDAKVSHYHGFSSGGHNAISRLKKEQEGIDYFLKKFNSNKSINIKMVHALHRLRINFIKTKNYFYNIMQKKYKPIDATIAVTYNCNSRCTMCNIWQIEKPAQLSLEIFNNLSPDLRYINISGGEPFLHPDLIDIITVVKLASPKAQIIISSNGLATDLIIKKMQELLKIDPTIGIRISIDGISEMHDKIRAITGFYEKAIKTIDELKKIKVNNLGLSFTIMDNNVEELIKVYNLSVEKGIEFALAMVQNSDIYFQKNDNTLTQIKKTKDGLNYIINKELKSWNVKKWFRAYYDYGLAYYAEHKKRLLSSGAGFDSLFIDAEGNIYPSNLINLKMGNIAEGKLDEIWKSSQAQKVRQEINNKNISESWIICTVRGQMKKNIFKVGIWVVMNKLKTMIGK
jgi:Fe-coproporphyrin III synthase